MFAAAGGASLAKRQARRNVRNKQHQHHTAVPVELHPHPPVPRNNALTVQHLQPRHSTASAHHLYRAPSHRRLSSYADLNGRIVGFGSIELAEVCVCVFLKK
ncbi:hypothetical protein ONE63_008608 [Megalurothrips usitatus]|uniref:Uncharacterized protein n=1 Tax=Megalurothrips usitatus TaxID=439358 RepID=A0AAV7XMR1_9NEOP|nr:hypothetical protein ONE63_008608 [Megalurothrips usitatus]